MPRYRRSGVKKSWAKCSKCQFLYSGKDAMARGAMHHDETGHVVLCEQTVIVEYGRRGVNVGSSR